MKMRKFIIEIHPNGSLTCCEYEDPKDVARAANNRSWLEGYRQALINCEEQVNALKGIKGSNITAGFIYQGATYVRDRVSNMYQKYCKDAAVDPRRKCPDCGCCCDMGGGNIDHPNGCKKL